MEQLAQNRSSAIGHRRAARSVLTGPPERPILVTLRAGSRLAPTGVANRLRERQRGDGF